MSALERAEEDIRAGDYGRARRRLESYLSAKGYDADIMNRLGQISYDMHDLFNAGRHWLVGTMQGEHVDRSIDIFVRASGGKPQQIATQVVRAARLDSIEHYPEAVQQRLSRLNLGAALAAAAPKAAKKPEESGLAVKVIKLIVILVCLAGLCVFIAGLQTVYHWLWG